MYEVARLRAEDGYAPRVYKDALTVMLFPLVSMLL